ncbi:MAG: TetR/AcrR family transcriptional regulator [Solirubrobacterales bacterium]|nr:TetR/AcrR family transcriptional regulator [Solirubrobacterales bacterium]
MEEEPRRLRADAERNRRRLIEAATAMFCEHGLEIGVGEIAQRAGVGRGTLFRNFPSKEHLVAAVVVDRIHRSIDRGRAALAAPDAGQALYDLIDRSIGWARDDRALFDAIGDKRLANPEIHAAHAELMDTLDALVRRAQDRGAVRSDIGAVDVLMMIKGVCEALRSFQHCDPEVGKRQLDLVWAAISTSEARRPLRGGPPPLSALDREPTEAADPGALSG